MSFEISEDVPDQEGLQPGLFQRRKAAVIIHCVEERVRGGKEVVEDAAFRIIRRSRDRRRVDPRLICRSGNVTLRTADRSKTAASMLGLARLLINGAGLK